MGELLTLKEIGQRMKVKPETVRRLWIKTGKLRAMKFGRQWRVDADDLAAAIAREDTSADPKKLSYPAEFE